MYFLVDHSCRVTKELVHIADESDEHLSWLAHKVLGVI